MPVVLPLAAAAVTAGATIYASNQSSHAVSQASAAQTATNNQALGEQQREYDTSRADFAPWRQAGQDALSQLAATHGISVPGATANGDPAHPFAAFEASPDYAFRVGEGERAITGNRAARGLLDSGSLGTGLINFGQRAGSQEYGAWYDRLSALAGVGQSATAQTTAAGENATNARTGILANQGDQLASSLATQGGIQAGMINGLGSTAAGLIQNWPGSTPTTFPTVTSADPNVLTASSIGASPSGLITPANLWGSPI